MEWIIVLPPLLTVAATSVVNAFVDPIGKTFDLRTRRVQFWKTMLETAQLSKTHERESYEIMCRYEMAEAADAVAFVTNKFVERLSGLCLSALRFYF